MDDRWIDEREGRARGWRTEGYGGGAGRSREGPSFEDGRYAARRSGPGRDRVFGERDTGGEYNRSSMTLGPSYDAGQRGWPDRSASGPSRSYGEPARDYRGGWQDRDYSGPSPAFHAHPPEGDHIASRGERFEARAYQAGQGLRRVGERISNFMGGFERPDHDDAPRGAATDFGPREHWADHRGRGPKNYMRSDARIHEEVCQRMTDDPWLDASEIEVDVSGGEVTLTGSVESREAKRRAEDLTENLAGVTNVRNDLRVGSAPRQV